MSLILDKINYVYSEGTAYQIQALKDVNLEIKDGQFIGVIGHTGSGKSTLIQHLNGLVKATSGTIYFNGQDIYDEDFDLRELRNRVGLVFQYPEHQLFETTIFDDVCFGPKNQGLSKEEAGLRAFEALRSVGLPEELYYQSPFDLSGGQKRRVAIAGVLAMKPEVLILDEPTAGLDPAGRDEILDLIARMHKEKGITVIQHLAVFQLLQIDPRNTVFTAQDQTILLFLLTLRQHRIHQPEKAFLPDRFQLVKISSNRIRFHRKLRG